jgi:biotin carboxylase
VVSSVDEEGDAILLRVLVIGTNRACHDRLRRLGHELVLFIPRSKATPADLEAPNQHLVVLDDGAEPSLWVDLAAACHRAAPFDRVAAFNEHTYVVTDAVAAALGIPCTVDVSLFQRVLAKPAARSILDQHGVPGVRHAGARDRDEIVAAIRQVGYPCIVKPVDGEASTGVSRLASAADIDPALARLGQEHLDHGVLVEEFLDGPEYSVEAISTAGRHHIVAITQKFKDELTFVERGHLVPAPVTAADRGAIEKYVTWVLDVLGFHDCPSHTELIMTADGPRFIETHNRIGGDRIMDLVQHATGLDMYELVARQSLGEDISGGLAVPASCSQYAAVWYADPSAHPQQRLAEVRGGDAVRERPYVKTLDVLRAVGSRHGPVRASSDRSALAVAVGDTAESAVSRARDAVGSLRFFYSWDPGM